MRTIVYGNGKSRQKWNVNQKLDNVVTWGCNRIFNDVKVDNLVAVDYHVQHLIYESGYAHENKCWFADWNILPSSVAYMDVTFGQGKKPNLPITENDRGERLNVVVNGKFTKPNEGLYITWVDEYNDKVINIDYPRGWSAGNTALYLACKFGAEEVYMCGFDGSNYAEPINNIYKGSKNYLPADSRGLNTINWDNQFRMIELEYPNVKFYKVGTELTYEELKNYIR